MVCEGVCLFVNLLRELPWEVIGNQCLHGWGHGSGLAGCGCYGEEEEKAARRIPARPLKSNPRHTTQSGEEWSALEKIKFTFSYLLSCRV